MENKKLTEQEYNELSELIYNGLDEKYNDEYFADDWDDAIRDAAETADVTPGFPAKITLDPDDSEPPVDPEFNGTDVEYDDIVDAQFAKWVEDLKADPQTPEALKANIEDEEVVEMLRDFFEECMVPFGEDSFNDYVFDRALDALTYDDEY